MLGVVVIGLGLLGGAAVIMAVRRRQRQVARVAGQALFPPQRQEMCCRCGPCLPKGLMSTPETHTAGHRSHRGGRGDPAVVALLLQAWR